MQKPGLDVLQAFDQVGLIVKRTTGSSQQPWVSTSPIDGSFYFSGGGTQVATAPPPPVQPSSPPAAPPVTVPPRGQSDFIFADSCNRLLTMGDLQPLSKDDLRI